ncbi:unnamed protein product [Fraxinus pennsylvanica]|uniref:Uncharacterized protein n=1 Tax=Fraxinus pennsylvanica TaxID=56036 RepID=A0AAD2AGS0_9LAMI|nr:unnamed protein product [Fraxinus pennsylvanica]
MAIRVVENDPHRAPVTVKAYAPPLPFPQRLRKKSMEQNIQARTIRSGVQLPEITAEKPERKDEQKKQSRRASVNLMPYSVYRKLRLGKVKSTSITPQLADRTISKPRGKVEDVLIKARNLIFPVDFIVLDILEDRDIPVILGRPFLATRRTLIDMEKGELILRVEGGQARHIQYEQPPNIKSCCRIDEEDLPDQRSCQKKN